MLFSKTFVKVIVIFIVMSVSLDVKLLSGIFTACSFFMQIRYMYV